MPHPLSLDDIFAIERVTDAQISPDGSQIAFVVTREFAEGEYTIPEASIWLVPTDGSAPARQFTAGAHADAQPRWRPDGKVLAFLSDRENANTLQVYMMPSDGGEARKLTSAKAGVSRFAWSPDGARVAYLATDAPSEEEEKRAKERDDAIHVDHDYKFTRLWVIEAAGGAPQALTAPEFQVRDFAWYGDGWAIVTSPTPKEDDVYLPWPVRLVNAAGAIETFWEGRYPTFLASARDGRSLAWIHTGEVGDEASEEVWFTRLGAAPRLAISDYSGRLVDIYITPDSQALLLIGIAGTRSIVGKLDLESGGVETLLSGKTLDAGFVGVMRVTISDDGVHMASVLEDADHPAEVFAWESDSKPRQVTHFNRHLAEVTLAHGETVEWTAPDGQRIEGVLLYPVGYEEGQRYPLIAHIHGGPGWFWLLRFLAGWHDWGQWLAAHGYAVLLPNPRGSAGRGREFLLATRRNWGYADLNDVLSGVDSLIARGVADPDRLGIGGWSYGGYLTSWAIGQTDRFKAAIAGAAVTNLLSEQAADIPNFLPQMMLAPSYRDQDIYLRSSPITHVANVKTPTLILHGASDERVPLGQGRELYAALQSLGVPSEMVVYPREPHVFQERAHQRDVLRRVLAWYDRWLKG